LAYGDPHIKTFDGKFVTLNMPLKFWLVRSQSFDMQVQTHWEKDGLLTHYALTGGQLGASTVVVRNDGLTDDFAIGKNLVKIFYKNGPTGSWERLVSKDWSEDVRGSIRFKHSVELDGSYKHIQPNADVWKWWDDQWEKYKSQIYLISLPDGSEITTVGIGGGLKNRPRLGVIIKMSQQPNMKGMCGNFDNNPVDDWPRPGGSSKSFYEPDVQKWFEQHLIAPDDFIDDDAPGLHLFEPSSGTRKSSVSAHKDGSSLIHASATPDDDPVMQGCMSDVKAAAISACSDLLLEERNACIYDICALNDTQAAVDEHMTELMEQMIFANESITVVDTMETSGRCLDAAGQTYTTVTVARMPVGIDGCEALVRNLTLAGLQGAQQLEGDHCQILFDELPDESGLYKKYSSAMGWGAAVVGAGKGIVDATSNELQWTCWRVRV